MSDAQACPFPDELRRLEEVGRKLDDALHEADEAVRRIDGEYMAEKRYMSEYRGEIDPHEMFQNELALKQIDGSGAFAVKVREQLARLKDSPYFARVDFRAEGEPGPSACYIGPFAFTREGELLICDWRSPVAGLFYDCQVGPAGYEAPIGPVRGALTRKRQFKITDGRMEYALETADSLRDDVLQRELSHTSDEKMKSIIATIQREQNRIIRSEGAGTLILQGVAGSGKTSIALHRLAYLLYRFKGRLSAGNILILSPNRVFGDYISTVLPELGEEPICALSLPDIAQVQLEDVVRFQPPRDPLEVSDEAWAERARFKSAPAFLPLLDRYLEQLPALAFTPMDYASGGFSAAADWIGARFRAYSKFPVRRRLVMIADDLHSKFASDPFADGDVPKPRTILKALTAMLRVKTTLALYQVFYRWLGSPELLALPAKNTLEWEDVFPFLYLHGAFEGLKASGVVKHLVVDEMQDYSLVQYAVLNRLFPCQKTILGDFGQRVDPNQTSTLEELLRLYPGAEFTALNKSYRSTYEIITFARALHPASALEPVARHGDEPRLLCCADAQEELSAIGAAIRRFEAGNHATLGVLARTGREARALYDALSPRYPVRLLTSETRRFENGVSIASIRMSKGLEFDEVLIPHADLDHYAAEHDRALLYVACTRAMHVLTLTYINTPSPLLPLSLPPYREDAL